MVIIQKFLGHADAVEVDLGMDDGEWSGSFHEMGQGSRARRQTLVSEHDKVLLQPPENLRMVPQLAAQKIDRSIGVGRESLAPVIEKLLIDVMMPPLERNGSGEENYLGMQNERSHKRVGGGWGQMFRHFDRDHQIESSRQVEGLFHVHGNDLPGGNLGELAIEPGAFDSNDLARAELLRNREPGTNPTANIEYGLGRIVLEKPREDEFRGNPIRLFFWPKLPMVQIVVNTLPWVIWMRHSTNHRLGNGELGCADSSNFTRDRPVPALSHTPVMVT